MTSPRPHPAQPHGKLCRYQLLNAPVRIFTVIPLAFSAFSAGAVGSALSADREKRYTLRGSGQIHRYAW